MSDARPLGSVSELTKISRPKPYNSYMNNTLDILIRIREDTKAALSSAEKNVQGFTSKANSFLNDHKQAITEAGVAAAGLIGTIGLVGSNFTKSASQIEQYRIALDTMLGPQGHANKLMEDA